MARHLPLPSVGFVHSLRYATRYLNHQQIGDVRVFFLHSNLRKFQFLGDSEWITLGIDGSVVRQIKRIVIVCWNEKNEFLNIVTGNAVGGTGQIVGQFIIDQLENLEQNCGTNVFTKVRYVMSDTG